jgi:hypothetical protein
MLVVYALEQCLRFLENVALNEVPCHALPSLDNNMGSDIQEEFLKHLVGLHFFAPDAS